MSNFYRYQDWNISVCTCITCFRDVRERNLFKRGCYTFSRLILLILADTCLAGLIKRFINLNLITDILVDVLIPLTAKKSFFNPNNVWSKESMMELRHHEAQSLHVDLHLHVVGKLGLVPERNIVTAERLTTPRLYFSPCMDTKPGDFLKMTRGDCIVQQCKSLKESKLKDQLAFSDKYP